MRGRTYKLILAAAIAVVVVPLAIGYAWWRHHYPYGMSHCCDLILYDALRQYAMTHGGAFPTGEATPEASLSLLYREKMDDRRLADERLLRGKTVSESVVKEILERGELLTPETCGWHYVEGLRLHDDPRLALFWDKVGLDHNGGLLVDGGHIVMTIEGGREHIRADEWEKFMERQRRLLAERGTAAEIRHDATIRIGNDGVKVQVRVMDDDIYGLSWSSGHSERRMIATLQKQKLGIQGLPVIPRDQIKNAKIVCEPEKSRVRFVLRRRDLIFDETGFHCEPSLAR